MRGGVFRDRDEREESGADAGGDAGEPIEHWDVDAGDEHAADGYADRRCDQGGVSERAGATDGWAAWGCAAALTRVVGARRGALLAELSKPGWEDRKEA